MRITGLDQAPLTDRPVAWCSRQGVFIVAEAPGRSQAANVVCAAVRFGFAAAIAFLVLAALVLLA